MSAAPVPAFELTVTGEPDTPVVALTGELDLETASELELVLEDLLARLPRSLRIDLGGLMFVDSSGVSLLLRINRLAHERRIELQLTGAAGSVRRVFELCGVCDVLALGA